jgi:hypothetical protein
VTAAVERTCDLEGCSVSRLVQPHYDDEDDREWDDAPDGWVLVDVDRPKAQTLPLEFCSEEHMRAFLMRPLPEPDTTPPLPQAEDDWTDKVFVAGCLTVLLVALLIFLLGLATAVQLLL